MHVEISATFVLLSVHLGPASGPNLTWDRSFRVSDLADSCLFPCFRCLDGIDQYVTWCAWQLIFIFFKPFIIQWPLPICQYQYLPQSPTPAASTPWSHPHTSNSTKATYACINSLAPGRFQWNLRKLIFKQISVTQTDGCDISGEILVMITLVREMANVDPGPRLNIRKDVFP